MKLDIPISETDPATNSIARCRARARFDALGRRGATFLGCEVPILCGAMSWVSERNLVAAVCDAGGYGVLAVGGMGPAMLANEIDATRALTHRPFGVNLVTVHPQFDALVEICADRVPDLVVLGGSLPPRPAIMRLKSAGARVACFSPTLAVARRLLRIGVDALIIEGSEAGGHIGPTATSVLAQEILPAISDVPVFVAGGIGRGEAIVAYLQMGAAGCQLGTLFACATESIAHPNFKAALIRASARDAVVSRGMSDLFDIIPVRALANKAQEEFLVAQRELIESVRQGKIDRTGARAAIEHFWAGRLRRAVIGGDIDNGSLMAGESVGMVQREQSAKAIIDALVDQAVNMLLMEKV